MKNLRLNITRATLLALFATALLALSGYLTLGQALVAYVGVQCIALCVARQRAACFTAPALTEEQLTEFKNILESVRGYATLFPDVKDLSTVEGGLKAIKGLPGSLKAATDDIAKIRGDLDLLRKAQIAQKSNVPARSGHVSSECARHLGGLALMAGLAQGQFQGSKSDAAASLFKDIMGVEFKAALTTSEIPLPTDYSGEVVELVSAYGAARRFGTVFPLGTGQVKLPKLTTDPTFGLIATSAPVPEKSPAFGWVTFNAEKFGGLIRLPTEIDEDSIVAVGQFVARYAARNIARVEDHNFFVGTGAGSGINGSVEGLAISTITNAKVTQMAATKTKYSDATLGNIRSIRAIVDAPVIGMGAYYMHPTFEQHLSGLNTAGDKPYQANGLNGATLDGFPIRWVDIMPAYSTAANVSKVFMLFGDVSYQYLGVRGGIRFDTSREAGFTTDEILIRALERLTTGLMANGSVSGLETAAA